MKMTFAFCAALLVTSGAFAASPSTQTSQMQVNAAGLNLARPADVAKLYRRISFAAETVCGPRNITGFYYTWSGYTSCVSAAIQQGVSAFNNASLTSYYQQRGASGQGIRVAAE